MTLQEQIDAIRERQRATTEDPFYVMLDAVSLLQDCAKEIAATQTRFEDAATLAAERGCENSELKERAAEQAKQYAFLHDRLEGERASAEILKSKVAEQLAELERLRITLDQIASYPVGALTSPHFVHIDMQRLAKDALSSRTPEEKQSFRQTYMNQPETIQDVCTRCGHHHGDHDNEAGRCEFHYCGCQSFRTSAPEESKEKL